MKSLTQEDRLKLRNVDKKTLLQAAENSEGYAVITGAKSRFVTVNSRPIADTADDILYYLDRLFEERDAEEVIADFGVNLPGSLIEMTGELNTLKPGKDIRYEVQLHLNRETSDVEISVGEYVAE